MAANLISPRVLCVYVTTFMEHNPSTEAGRQIPRDLRSPVDPYRVCIRMSPQPVLNHTNLDHTILTIHFNMILAVRCVVMTSKTDPIAIVSADRGYCRVPPLVASCCSGAVLAGKHDNSCPFPSPPAPHTSDPEIAPQGHTLGAGLVLRVPAASLHVGCWKLMFSFFFLGLLAAVC